MRVEEVCWICQVRDGRDSPASRKPSISSLSQHSLLLFDLSFSGMWLTPECVYRKCLGSTFLLCKYKASYIICKIKIWGPLFKKVYFLLLWSLNLLWWFLFAIQCCTFSSMGIFTRPVHLGHCRREGRGLVLGRDWGWPRIHSKEALGDRTVVEPRFQSLSTSSVVPLEQIKIKLLRISRWQLQSIQPKGRPIFWIWDLL